jgi:hypothetical protein
MPNSLFETVMKAPNVWTGKDGVTSVAGLLSNAPLQDKIQENLIRSSYTQLVGNGSIVESASAAAGALTGSVLTGSGISSLSGSLGGTLGGLASGGIGGALGGLAGKATGALGALTGGLPGGLGALTGGLPGGLGGLAGASQKISQFKLQSIISSGGLGGLSGVKAAAVGLLDSATGALGGALGSISGAGGLAGAESVAVSDGASKLGGLLQTASKFGADTATSWAKGALPAGAAGLMGQMDALGKQGEFAINFNDMKLPSIAAGTSPAGAFAGTINRATLDLATAKLVGSDKIKLPSFTVPSLEALNDPASLMGAAKSALGGIGNLSSLGQSALKGLSGGLGGSISGIGGALGSLTSGGGIGGALGGLTGATGGALGSAQNILAQAASIKSKLG